MVGYSTKTQALVDRNHEGITVHLSTRVLSGWLFTVMEYMQWSQLLRDMIIKVISSFVYLNPSIFRVNIRSLIHFKLTFVMMWVRNQRSHFCMRLISLLKTNCRRLLNFMPSFFKEKTPAYKIECISGIHYTLMLIYSILRSRPKNCSLRLHYSRMPCFITVCNIVFYST